MMHSGPDPARADADGIVVAASYENTSSSTISSSTTTSTRFHTHLTESDTHPSWLRLLPDDNPSQGSLAEPSATLGSQKTSMLSVGELVLYSAFMDPKTAQLVATQQEEHRIKHLIPDLPVKAYGRVQRRPPSWGLDRIDQHSDRLDGYFHYPSSAGDNVTIYIIDTGVNINHRDFGGRASHGPVFLPGTIDPTDRNGHGTFVAALAAGSTYGVAKRARIISLKALDDQGAGRLSNILAAIEWIVKRHVGQGKDARSIINLSLGAEHNEPTNAAILEAMKLGIHFSIAAGNDGRDACEFSPASTPGALTVGATERDDTVASYSNFGPCVSIYAPGSDVVSAWVGSDTATHSRSGTSMASPLVAGLMALILSESPDQDIPARSMIKQVLNTVTLFNIKENSGPDSMAAPSRTNPSSSSLIDSLIHNADSGSIAQQGQSTSRKHLANNLVYVGSLSHGRGSEPDIEDEFPSYMSFARRAPSPSLPNQFILFILAMTILSGV
ncbi:hypothetical protein BGW38_010389 [Lunasporangiospora selenospora]|uniref:Peptidase S8/S53 domain-containing protein n=1 Tax=Lunasporangiospora selenospora TaxID=979761 RepID=A0A9P6FWJ2_9FUNG|nr:hypothetical protein BGW38_010389 [Lunasporangiospora selenospora]